jgi:hypothetical protein
MARFSPSAQKARDKFDDRERAIARETLQTPEAQEERSKNFNESYYECLLACVVLRDRDLLDILSNDDSKCQFLKEYDRFIADYHSSTVDAFMQDKYTIEKMQQNDPDNYVLDNYVLDVGGALVTEVLSSFSLEVPFTDEGTAIAGYLNSLLPPAAEAQGLGNGQGLGFGLDNVAQVSGEHQNSNSPISNSMVAVAAATPPATPPFAAASNNSYVTPPPKQNSTRPFDSQDPGGLSITTDMDSETTTDQSFFSRIFGSKKSGGRRTIKVKKYLKNNRKKTVRKSKKTIRKTIRKNKKTRKSKA